MHLLGKSMKGYGITPTHDTIPFYDIPKWSFYWQNIYLFRKVIKIPVGTVFYVEAVYDNTTNNLLNPNSPPQNVGYGEATSDEMLLNFFLITKYQHADQNIIIDSAAFFSNDTGLDAPDDFLPEMVVSPNPVESEFTVSFNLPESGNTQLQQFDLCGRLIRNLFSERMMEAGDYTFSYHTGSLTNGIYFLKLKCGGKSVVSKIAITGK
jgi:hypothetical protein